MQVFAASLAALAIALHALWPLIVQARPKQAPMLVPVCTVDGVTHYLELPAGRSLFISPGLSYALTDKLQVYGFLQLPVYQYVNGVQLTAKHAVAIGISGRF